MLNVKNRGKGKIRVFGNDRYSHLLKQPYPGVPNRNIFSTTNSSGYDSFQGLFLILRSLAMVDVQWTTTVALAWTLKAHQCIQYSNFSNKLDFGILIKS